METLTAPTAPALIPATVYAVDLEVGDELTRDGMPVRIVSIGKPRTGSHGFRTLGVILERTDLPAGHLMRAGFLLVDTVDIRRAAPEGLGR